VGPERLHVTLAFLGERSPADADAAAEVLRAQAGRLAALDPGELRATEALALPPRRPRAAAVGLAGGQGRLEALQAHLAGSLVAAGVLAPEARPFLPHVTVARARRGARPARGLPGAPALEFRPRAVTLFESRTGGPAPRYVGLGTVALPGG
jgi:RNA 2',3'-cyclic 3'-phosphodiesterase